MHKVFFRVLKLFSQVWVVVKVAARSLLCLPTSHCHNAAGLFNLRYSCPLARIGQLGT
jgi:hypothetical protein